MDIGGHLCTLLSGPLRALPGAAFVHTESGGTWTQQAELAGSDLAFVREAGFGFSVSISGGTAMVGDPFGSVGGAVYVFDLPTVVVNVSGSQAYGSSGPAFTNTANTAGLTGSLSCTSVNGGTLISPSLDAGSYTIDGPSCSGLSAPAGYVVSYVGVIDGFVVDQAPVFTDDNPPLTATAGQIYAYNFAATGFPVPTYALDSAARSWLSVNASTGALSGTVPAGTTSFSYSVTATNSVGSPVKAGPLTLTVSPAAPTVSPVFTGSLSYTNSGAITGGTINTEPSSGRLRTVSGTITIAGLDGGSATISVQIVRDHDVYTGYIKVSDPSAYLETTALVLTRNLARSVDGLVNGSATGTHHRRPYSLQFSI